MQRKSVLEVRPTDRALSPDEIEGYIIENFSCARWPIGFEQACLIDERGSVVWLPFEDDSFEAFLMGLHGSPLWGPGSDGVSDATYDSWQHGRSLREPWLRKTRWVRAVPYAILIAAVVLSLILSPR